MKPSVKKMVKITKNSSEKYSAIFKVNVPVEFFFAKNGSFDGIGIDTQRTTVKEIELAKELCSKILR